MYDIQYSMINCTSVQFFLINYTPREVLYSTVLYCTVLYCTKQQYFRKLRFPVHDGGIRRIICYGSVKGHGNTPKLRMRMKNENYFPESTVHGRNQG